MLFRFQSSKCPDTVAIPYCATTRYRNTHKPRTVTKNHKPAAIRNAASAPGVFTALLVTLGIGMSIRTSTKVSARKPAVLAGGNPPISKADGDAPVRAYVAAMPSWKRDIGRRLALIVRDVPGVRKA